MNRPFIPPELLQKYLNGTATPAERATVDAWYESLRGPSDYLSTLPAADQEALRHDTFRAISQHLNESPVRSPDRQPARRWWISRSWAAVGGIAAAIALLLWFVWPGLVGRLRSDRPVATAPASVRFVNHTSRIVQQPLPDGTIVWLHPLAELRYPKRFTGRWRDVRFAGEAFFDVAKDARHPFRIQSGTLQIQVVGTSFNVRATPRHALFEVAVVTGKVVVRSLAKARHRSATVTLLPRQEAFYNVATAQFTQYVQPERPRREIYEPVSIAFSDMPIDRVLRQLEARFRIRIRVANPSLDRCRLTADFTDQPLPVILELLCTSLDATYTMAGETIVLNGDGCP